MRTGIAKATRSDAIKTAQQIEDSWSRFGIIFSADAINARRTARRLSLVGSG
jgi:hypothetical protein